MQKTKKYYAKQEREMQHVCKKRMHAWSPQSKRERKKEERRKRIKEHPQNRRPNHTLFSSTFFSPCFCLFFCPTSLGTSTSSKIGCYDKKEVKREEKEVFSATWQYNKTWISPVLRFSYYLFIWFFHLHHGWSWWYAICLALTFGYNIFKIYICVINFYCYIPIYCTHRLFRHLFQLCLSVGIIISTIVSLLLSSHKLIVKI